MASGSRSGAQSTIERLERQIAEAERDARAAAARQKRLDVVAKDTRRRQSARQKANLYRGELSAAERGLRAAIADARSAAGTNNVGALRRAVGSAKYWAGQAERTGRRVDEWAEVGGGAKDKAPGKKPAGGDVLGVPIPGQGADPAEGGSADREGFRVGLASGAPPAGAPNIDPRKLQELLRDAGFYKGRIDGIIGPKTRAAIASWEAAGRPGADGTPLSPDADFSARRSAAFDPAAPAGIGSGGGVGSAPAAAAVGGGTFGGGQAAGVVPANPLAPFTETPESFRRHILENFPEMEPFMKIPEVSEVLRLALREGWPSNKLAAEVKQTDWWRTTPSKSRAWLGLYAMDPASADAKVKDEASKMRQLADQYALDLADVTLEQWARKELSGEIGEDGFGEYLREQAKSMFPSLAKAIDQGITVDQYADPYRQTAARMLEIAPESIRWSDPKWNRALQTIDPQTGQRVSMSLADWQTLIRTDAAYGFDRTSQAQAAAAEFAGQLAKTFGRVG